MEFKNLKQLKFENLNDNNYDFVFRNVPIEDFGVSAVNDWDLAKDGSNFKNIELVNWHLVDISRNDKSMGTIFVGSGQGGEFCTSPVMFLAPNRTAGITKSGSLYDLGKPGTGNPDASQTLMLVATLRYWGLGTVVEGWPDVFF